MSAPDLDRWTPIRLTWTAGDAEVACASQENAVKKFLRLHVTGP